MDSILLCMTLVSVVSVELAQSEYSAPEGDGFLMVCVNIFQAIERNVAVKLATNAISAQGG